MTVYVTQEAKINGRTMNFGPALKFGEVKFLSGEWVQLQFNPAPTIAELRTKLKNYDPEKDWILPVGDPALMGVAIALAAKFGNGKVRLLKWDRATRDYLPLTMEI